MRALQFHINRSGQVATCGMSGPCQLGADCHFTSMQELSAILAKRPKRLPPTGLVASHPDLIDALHILLETNGGRKPLVITEEGQIIKCPSEHGGEDCLGGLHLSEGADARAVLNSQQSRARKEDDPRKKALRNLGNSWILPETFEERVYFDKSQFPKILELDIEGKFEGNLVGESRFLVLQASIPRKCWIDLTTEEIVAEPPKWYRGTRANREDKLMLQKKLISHFEAKKAEVLAGL